MCLWSNIPGHVFEKSLPLGRTATGEAVGESEPGMDMLPGDEVFWRKHVEFMLRLPVQTWTAKQFKQMQRMAALTGRTAAMVETGGRPPWADSLSLRSNHVRGHRVFPSTQLLLR